MSGSVSVKIHRSAEILKEISEPVDLNNRNWTEYAKSVKIVQKTVNAYLTELVEAEKDAATEECGESDDEEESPKRKLDNSDNLSRKKSRK